MVQDVGGQRAGRFVTPIAVLFQGLHHNPVELSAYILAKPGWFGMAIGCDRWQGCARAESRAGSWRVLFADDPQRFVKCFRLQALLFEWRVAGKQLVE